MTETRYKVVISREGQPAHQMAEMTATVSGTILLGIVRAMIAGESEEGIAEWTSPSAFGTFKSLTITRLEDDER